jgi:hypothetical protein
MNELIVQNKGTEMHFNMNASIFKNADPKHFNEKFLQWFVGYVDGHGLTKVSNNQFELVISHREKAFLQKVRDILGFGEISQGKNESWWLLRFSNNENHQLFSHVLHGNLVTEKAQNDLREYYTKLKVEQQNLDESAIKSTVLPSLKTGWLAGMMDANAHFVIVKTLNPSPEFRICIEHTERVTLEKIAECIKKVHSAKGTISKQDSRYRLTYASRNLIQRVFLPYVKEFPLLRDVQTVRYKQFFNILHKNFNLNISKIGLEDDIKSFRCKEKK